MPRFASRRRSFTAALAVSAALLLAPLGTAHPAAAAVIPAAVTPATVMAGPLAPLEIYDWAEVYFGTGEVAQGETLQVTVSDLRTGRIITATLGDGAVVVADIPAADRYGDTGFAVPVPADFPVGVHNLTIATDEFAPIVIPITVTPGRATPTTEPSPVATTAPATPTDHPTQPGGESTPPGSASPFEPPVPITAVYGVLGGIVGIIIITAVVRGIRRRGA